MGVKKQIWPPCRHFWNRTKNKWAFMLALLSFLSAPSSKEIQFVHNPQTIPDLGVKFQTIWSIHFWEIAVHGSTDVGLRTDVRTARRTDGDQINYKPPNPPGWGIKRGRSGWSRGGRVRGSQPPVGIVGLQLNRPPNPPTPIHTPTPLIVTAPPPPLAPSYRSAPAGVWCKPLA